MRSPICVELLSFVSLATAGTVIDLGYAKYQGNLSYPNTVAYLGLPYAEPPVGDLRWRTPVPLNTTRVSQQAQGDIIDATKYPDFCIQGSRGGESGVMHPGTELALTMHYSRGRCRRGGERRLLESECLRTG